MLLDHILCEWRLVRDYFECVWVILGGWGWVSHYFGWMGVGGPLFWVDCGGWVIILGVWG